MEKKNCEETEKRPVRGKGGGGNIPARGNIGGGGMVCDFLRGKGRTFAAQSLSSGSIGGGRRLRRSLSQRGIQFYHHAHREGGDITSSSKKN